MRAARGAPPEIQDSAEPGSGHHRFQTTDTRSRPGARDTVVLFLAASLTRPFQAVIDSFTARTGAVVQRESGGSLDHVRKITELHRVPDLLALADAEVFPQLLMPAHATWYAEFARDRMVVAYTPRSRDAADIDSIRWTRILARPDVQVGRADPAVAPVGYRTLLMLRLAEAHYRDPGLAARLLANAPRRNMRPTASELAALLSLGELDYIYDYESVARAYGFRFLRLPPAIDLGDPARARDYATASVTVANVQRDREHHPGDSVIVGRPIVFALTVPKAAPHPAAARRFTAYLLSAAGRALVRAGQLDLLEPPILVGSGIPEEIRGAVAH